MASSPSSRSADLEVEGVADSVLFFSLVLGRSVRTTLSFSAHTLLTLHFLSLMALSLSSTTGPVANSELVGVF